MAVILHHPVSFTETLKNLCQAVPYLLSLPTRIRIMAVKKINLRFFTTTCNHFLSLYLVWIGKRSNQTKTKFKDYYYSCKTKPINDIFLSWVSALLYVPYFMIIHCFSQSFLPQLEMTMLWTWMEVTSWRLLSRIRPLSYFWQKWQNVQLGNWILS